MDFKTMGRHRKMPIYPCKLPAVLLFIFFLFTGCSPPSELKWNQGENLRWAEVTPGFFGSPGFKALTSDLTQIEFENRLTEEDIDKNQHYLNGSGVAAGDVDGDGLIDLYFASLSGPNKLYRNLGKMVFEDVTDRAGVAHEGYYSTGVVFADIDGDGDLDLLVASMHRGTVLYTNDGAGAFTVQKESGLGSSKGSTTMALADIEGDGDLDLYITNYKEYTVKDLFTTEELAWDNILKEPYSRQQQTGPYTLVPPFDRHYQIFMTEDNQFAGGAEIGERDELYINRDGSFEKVEDTRQVFLGADGEPQGLQLDWGLTAKFQDLNGDGFPDLYVCNDFFTKDRVWLNQGNGTFRAVGWQAIRNFSFSSMGVDFSDINRDGELDIFTTEMLNADHERHLQSAVLDDPATIRIGDIESQTMHNRNSMYLKREDDTYAEITYLSGVEATGWSWDATFMDVDLDGYEDIIVNTGYLNNILDIDTQIDMMRRGRNMDEHFLQLILSAPSLDLPNRILANNGDLTFRDQGADWGFTEPDVSHGMAVADLNNDGALDLVMNRMNRKAAVFQNTSSAPRIAVRLKGRPPNTQAIGAVIELQGGPVPQQKEMAAGGDYMSGSDPMAMFAADPDNNHHRLAITWPDGNRFSIDSIQANRIYEIFEPEGQPGEPPRAPEQIEAESETQFNDISGRISHRHHEEPFPDFAIQPLLPVRLSQLGPGVAWLDYNRDGSDDLLIVSGTGGELALFENRGNGDGFVSVKRSPLTDKAPGDQTAIIGWKENNSTRVIVGSANYEQGKLDAPSAFIFEIDSLGSVKKDSIPGVYSTTGPVAAADVDGDGYLDLFVGGQLNPGQYPANASSRIFRNEKGSFRLDEVNSRKFSEMGMVTGAVFSDLTRNGRPDLLISTQWGTLRLFENQDGIFNEITAEAGLDLNSGWWNGVATGDFNNDGYPDIVAANIGRNSRYRLNGEHPLRIYYDDLNNNGRMDIIEAYPDGSGNYLPRKPLFEYRSQQIGLNRMDSHREFAESTLEEILGSRFSRTPFKEINTLRSTVFINRGGTFTAHPLPVEAQFSIAFNPGVADFDNDGKEDLFLSQNLFALPKGVSRLDAGRGLWLKGDGQGGFTPVPGSRSGIKIYGEQRGAALGDFDRDGRIDLAVTQNGAPTRLYRNNAEKPGIRVRLTGPESNEDGMGSGIRLVYRSGEKGPLREIQAGSGYWSQNSSTQVMGAAGEPVQIEVTWFDGSVQSVSIVPGKWEYRVRYADI